jgi:hypothetical protein
MAKKQFLYTPHFASSLFCFFKKGLPKKQCHLVSKIFVKLMISKRSPAYFTKWTGLLFVYCFDKTGCGIDKVN